MRQAKLARKIAASQLIFAFFAKKLASIAKPSDFHGMEIADALKKELRELGLSRVWLAQACGCSLSTINHALASGGNKRARQRIVVALRLEQKRRKLQVLAKVAEEIIQAAQDSDSQTTASGALPAASSSSS